MTETEAPRVTDFPPYAVWKAKREKDHRCTCETCWFAFLRGHGWPL